MRKECSEVLRKKAGAAIAFAVDQCNLIIYMIQKRGSITRTDALLVHLTSADTMHRGFLQNTLQA